jgi:hypothetical protein
MITLEHVGPGPQPASPPARAPGHRTAPPRRSPSRTGYSVAAVLALATPVVAVAVLVLGLSLAEQRIDGLTRTAVPGTVTLAAAGSRTMTVYAEGDFSDVTLTVTGPDGPVVLSAHTGTPAYERDGLACVAAASFTTTSAGRYVVRATGDMPSGTRVAVGPDVTEALVASATVPYVAVGLGLFGLAAIALATYRRRAAPPEKTWW